MTPAAPSPIATDQRTTSTTVPGLPVLPGVVTVVPFQLVHGNVNVQAALDGRRGTYTLDTGSPLFWLNPTYLRPDSLGGIDTVITADESREGYVTIHTMQLGPLLEHLDSTDVGVPIPLPTNANIRASASFNEYGDHEIGTIGLNAMEPFETIIDYVHRRLVLIRLDKAGRRLAAVPLYTPAYTVPLLPVQEHWWGVEGNLGGVVDTLMIDTGNSDNTLISDTRRRIEAHLTSADPKPEIFSGERATLDHLIIAGHTIDALPFSIDYSHENTLGYTFLSRLGVVGFNLRTHQFVVYR